MMSHLRDDASPLNIGRPAHAPDNGEAMPDKRANGSLVKLVLTDLQFWVPVAVLAGGLLVLRWIS
jgi:hypothetical protein